MHRLLRRQLRKYLSVEDEVPAALQSFLAAVDTAYVDFDSDRAMLERSLELSSKELSGARDEATVAERRIVADAVERPQQWVEQRLAQHRNPSGPVLQPQSDGRWIQINERKTQDGGTVGVFTDVTEIKRREEELTEANRSKDTALHQLQAVLATIDYGFLFMDAEL